ncbi:Uncharacterised protein [Escherichia coli]|nr:hypothetical protein [Escherichia coli]EFH3911745.1 hypothetical protein [Escherichia coli]EFH5650044.1 hypothetical protein [Escherichia coli]EFH7621459.1 hypothetical protein [Escherichia coli]EFH7714256.1 hypothetical protein [Escherichia coli]
MSQLFYFDKALKALQYGQTLTSKDGVNLLFRKEYRWFCTAPCPIYPSGS